MVEYPHKVAENNPSLKGSLAGKRMLFGDWARYAVAPVHTRWDAVSWFVWDAEYINEKTGHPEVIRQAPTFEEAVKGLGVMVGPFF
jgi:hypothetical protein